MKKRIVVFAGTECREGKEDYYYNLAYKTGNLLAKAGFIVATGGGPGLMNQVAKGAVEAGGETIGVCLALPGRKQSEYLTKRYIFHSLNPRQEKLLSLGDGFVAIPGGIGTLYEIVAVLALKRKMEISRNKPLIFVDSYYREFKVFVEKIKSEGFISKEIDSLYMLVNTPEEVLEKLQ